MTEVSRNQIESALERNQPFTVKMADGKEYEVPHRDYLFLPPQGSYVIVVDDESHVNVLPLLTMTGLSYRMRAAESEA